MSRLRSFIVSITVTCSLTSWLRSLSPLEITVLMPRSVAMHDSVPITSSASTPGTCSTFQPSSRTTSWIGSICARRSGGIGERVALYCAYRSSRNVLPGASNTQAT